MNKIKLFLDFDGTITNSVESFIKTYNIKHNTNLDWTKVEKYDFLDLIPELTHDEKYSIFDSQAFFDNLDFINYNTYEILKQLSHKYEICIATIGTPLNLSLKAIWINKNIPFIRNYCFIYNSDCGMNKSIINCPENSIFIDDCHANLLSVTSKHKIVFGDDYEWSQTLDGLIRCYNWTDLSKLLL